MQILRTANVVSMYTEKIKQKGDEGNNKLVNMISAVLEQILKERAWRQIEYKLITTLV